MKQNIGMSPAGARPLVAAAAALVILGAASCGLLGTYPEGLPDYVDDQGFILDFTVGDKCITKQPLYYHSHGGEPALSRPGIGYPDLEKYLANPGAFSYIEEVVPPGTEVQLVAIKDAGYHTAVTFVTMDGHEDWISMGLDEYTKVGVNYHRQYDREWFDKITAVSAPAELERDE